MNFLSIPETWNAKESDDNFVARREGKSTLKDCFKGNIFMLYH